MPSQISVKTSVQGFALQRKKTTPNVNISFEKRLQNFVIKKQREEVPTFKLNLDKITAEEFTSERHFSELCYTNAFKKAPITSRGGTAAATQRRRIKPLIETHTTSQMLSNP